MARIDRNFLNDTDFKLWVKEDFPNSGIWASNKDTTDMIKEMTIYLAQCQAVVAAAAVINPIETDPVT